MRNIYTCVDIGTDTIRFVTAEYYNGKYNILASTSVLSKGVKKGKICDATLICNALKKGFKQMENKLGTKILDVIAIVPSDNMAITIASASVENLSEDKKITGDLVFNCMQKSLKNNVNYGMEVVGVFPIEYVLDDGEKVKQVLGMESDSLSMKSVIVSVPEKNVLTVVSVLKSIGVDVVDVMTSEIANYYVIKNNDFDSKVIALVDIGSDKTSVAVFNKGIIIKNSLLPVGGNNIDYDVANFYNMSLDNAKAMRENFAVCNRKYADSDEVYDTINLNNEKIKVDQFQLAEIIEMRIIDILKNAKIEANSLTNREIGYIMITGGISSMLGFSTIVEDLYPRNASNFVLNILGIRDNKFSAAYGGIKYFNDKLTLREKKYTMFNENKVEEMLSPRKKTGSVNMLGKIFGRIFD